MIRLLVTLSLRFFRLHPGQLVALLLSLCVGCGGFIAIVALNQSTLQQFEQAGQTLNGGATHRIVGDGVDFKLWQRLRTEFSLPNSSGVLRGSARAFGRRVDVIAVDPLSDMRLQRQVFQLTNMASAYVESAAAIPVLLSPDLAAFLNQSDKLELNGLSLPITGAGIANVSGWSGIALDLADWYRFDAGASLSHIDLRLTEADVKRWPAIEVQLNSVSLRAIDRPGRVLGELSKALRTNLLALALLALLVSVVLIGLSLRYAYLLRQPDFLRLRMLGLSQRQLLVYLSIEALALGLIGGLLGLMLGLALADQLAAPLGQTLQALYQSNVRATSDVPISLRALSLVLAMLAALAGSIWPMLQSVNLSITAQAQGITKKISPRKRVAVVLVLLPIAALLLQRQNLIAAFAGLFCLTLALLLPLPAALHWFLQTVQTAAGRARTSVMLTHAIALRSLPTMAGALTALCLALATPLGLDLMVGSFRATIVDWIDHGVPGDLFVSSDGWLYESDRQALSTLPGITAIYTTRHVEQQDAQGLFDLMVIEGAASRLASMQTLAGRTDAQEFIAGNVVFVSEAFASKRNITIGAQIQVSGKPRTIAAIFRDYRSEQGVIAIAEQVHQPDANLRRFNNVAVVTSDQAIAEQALRQWLGAHAQLGLRLNTRSELRQGTLAVFDATFALTDRLKYLTALIASLGLFAALMALNIELAGTDQRLRALGMSASERRLLRFLSAQALAFLAAVFAMPLGLVLANMLTQVINARAFGWRFELHLDAIAFLKLPLIALIAASLAQLAAHALKSHRASDLFQEQR